MSDPTAPDSTAPEPNEPQTPSANDASPPAEAAAESSTAPGDATASGQRGAEPTKPSKPEKPTGLWHAWIKPIAQVVLVVFLVRALVVDWNDVPSGSMEPTIQVGDRVVVNKLAYGMNFPVPFLRHDGEGKGFLDLPFTHKNVPLPIPGQPVRWGDPERGDIVIVWSPQPTTFDSRGRLATGPLGIRLIKRVIGVPGDVIEVRNGVLLINGEAAQYDDEQPLTIDTTRVRPTSVWDSPAMFIPMIVLGAGAFFLLGGKPEAASSRRTTLGVALLVGALWLFMLGKVGKPSPGELQGVTMGESILGDTRATQWPDGEQPATLPEPRVSQRAPRNVGPITLGETQYWMMGDNRTLSNDSRGYGPVDRSQIVGRASVIAVSFDGRLWNGSLRPNFGRWFKKLN